MDTRTVSRQSSESVQKPKKQQLGDGEAGEAGEAWGAISPSASSAPSAPSNIIKDTENFSKVCAAVRAGNSVLVLGEAGTGKDDFALALHEELLGEFNSAMPSASVAIATYKGSIKKFFMAIALNIML